MPKIQIGFFCNSGFFLLLVCYLLNQLHGNFITNMKLNDNFVGIKGIFGLTAFKHTVNYVHTHILQKHVIDSLLCIE